MLVVFNIKNYNVGKPKHEPVTFTMYVTNLHKFKTMSFLKFHF